MILRLMFMCLVVFLFCPAQPQAQDQMATYHVEIAFDWAVSEDADQPANPHWSRLLVVAHSSRYALFHDGLTASSGLALVATNGRVSVLEAELAEARRRGRAGQPLVLSGLNSGAGAFEFELVVDRKLPQVSFATMLAPSPDWFSGASGIALFVGGTWLERIQIPLWVWDAGADSGTDFESPDSVTQPRESVRLLAHPAFLTDAGMTPIGVAIFVRQK